MAIGFIEGVGSSKINPPLTAEPSDVLLGRTFSKDGKVILTGTKNLDNLIPSNVRRGINIAGVVGTMKPFDMKLPKQFNKGVPGEHYTGVETLTKEFVLADLPANTTAVAFICKDVGLYRLSGSPDDTKRVEILAGDTVVYSKVVDHLAETSLCDFYFGSMLICLDPNNSRLYAAIQRRVPDGVRYISVPYYGASIPSLKIRFKVEAWNRTYMYVHLNTEGYYTSFVST